MESKDRIFVGEIDNPEGTPDAIKQKMERRSKRSVNAVERRAKYSIKELEDREKEYIELIDDRIDQLKERYFVDRGVDQRVTAAQESANVLKKEISAEASKARHEISGRIERFKDGIAIARIGVDAEILTVDAACAFVDNVQVHSRLTLDRIDSNFSDADTAMRRRVNRLEPVF